MVQNPEQQAAEQDRALTPTARVLFALAFGVGIWFVMRAASIQPVLCSNFWISPGYLLLLVGVAGPTWAALLVSSIAPGDGDRKAFIHRLLWWRVGVGWYLIALGLPLLLALMTAVCYTLAGGRGFAGLQFGPLVGLVPLLLWTLVLGGPLEEELGWRGFAFPLLRARTNAVVSCLIIGVLWASGISRCFCCQERPAWPRDAHYPLGILWFVGFVIQMMALSVLFGWLVTRTGGCADCDSVPYWCQYGL